jgi:hypothetical protein
VSGKLNDVQRAQRYADRWATIPQLTQQEAVRAGFRAGLKAAKSDLVPRVNADREELQARFLFLVRKGLWDEFQAQRYASGGERNTPNTEGQRP